MTINKNVSIGLFNPKSPSNVGAVLRAAGCYGVREVRYCGERFDRAKKYQTDTKNVGSTIPLIHENDLLSRRPPDIALICVEIAEGATSLPAFTHPENALYCFGPEDGSLPQRLIDAADDVVYVPTFGCMNLAASVNVILYDRLAKSDSDIDHQQRILRSRDSNNRLKVGSV